jgi:glycosyltransferase involved in cell wall biosynthesis
MAVERVVMVQGSAHRAGAEVMLLGRLAWLRSFDIEPSVAFLTDGPFVEEVRALGVPVAVLADEPARVRRPWQIPDQVTAVAEFARKQGATVIEGCGEKMSIWAGWAARRAGCASVLQFHDGPWRTINAAITQLGAVIAPHDAIVVCSKWMAREFRRRLGVRTIPVHSGVQLERLPASPADIRTEYGWPQDAPVVTIPGRLQSWKGQDVFLRAAARVADAIPQARFVVLGGALYGWDQEFAARLPRLAASLGIAGRVAFTGHRDDALAVVAGSDIVAHCSTSPEPFGMVVIEAMALGRPVIASNTGGPPEIIDDGETGLLIPPGQPGPLAEAIVGLLRDDRRRRAIAEAGREVARQQFSAETMTRTLAAVYQRASVAARQRAA